MQNITKPQGTMIQRVLLSLWNSDGRQIIYYCSRLGLGEQFGYPLTRFLRFLRNPFAHFVRTSARNQVNLRATFDNVVSLDKGYGEIKSGALPHLEPIIRLVKTLRDERSGKPEYRGERFRETILTPTDLQLYPELREFVCSDTLIQIASDYFGAVPVLRTVQGWWSVYNEYLESSQLFHVDSNDRRTLKFLINIEDVTESDGPFTFIPANITKQILTNIAAPNQRITDEEVFKYCHAEDVVHAVGPAGTCFIVDGARCLHFGARTREGSRLLLLVEFHSFFCPKAANIPLEPSEDWFPADKLRQLVLGLR